MKDCQISFCPHFAVRESERQIIKQQVCTNQAQRMYFVVLLNFLPRFLMLFLTYYIYNGLCFLISYTKVGEEENPD